MQAGGKDARTGGGGEKVNAVAVNCYVLFYVRFRALNGCYITWMKACIIKILIICVSWSIFTSLSRRMYDPVRPESEGIRGMDFVASYGPFKWIASKI
jgi:hypothetical protein